MLNETLIQEIADLFMETGHAHHQAFIEVDGNDPDWPLWYAEQLQEKLGNLLKADFTKSTLVYLLVLLDIERAHQAPGAKWPLFYSKTLVARYV